MKYYFALLSIVLILGCVNTQAPSFSGKAVVKGDNISVDYTGMLENGTIFDSSIGRAPLQFSAGAGQMIKGFDAAVIGMHEGEEKNVTIQPQDAYGIYDPKNVIEFPIANVPAGTKAGDMLYAGTQQVRVVEINNETVFIDTNHPLAGKTLVFRMRIVNIY